MAGLLLNNGEEMKKVMIGILLIIPVIIVLVVAMVSVFVSMSAHIAVDSITLSENYIELEYDSTISAYKISDLVTATIAPTRASDKTYTWSIESIRYKDEEYEAMVEEGALPLGALLSEDESGTSMVHDHDDESYNTCSQDGYIHINTYCIVTLKAQAETHHAICTIDVVGYRVESIKAKCDQYLSIGQNALIAVETSPIEAIVERWIYESSDESVVTIDQNGVVSAVGAGTATITVKASVYGEEDTYVEASTEITIRDNVTVYGDSITTSNEELLFADLGISADEVNIEASVGVKLNGAGTGIVITDDIAVLVVNGKDVIISKCDEDEIVIDHANLFEAKEEGGYVLATEGKLYLTASYADDFKDGRPSVTWSSNREAVAKVDDNGIVTGVSSGRAIITATSTDGQSTSVTINVQEVVAVLLVETPDACKEEGIARETVNGSMVYVDVLQGVDDLTFYVPKVADFNFAKKDNSFEFNFQRPILPDNANKEEFYSAFKFNVQEYVGEGEDRHLQDTDKARFESNRMVFNGETIDGLTELVVTISAKYPKFQSKPQYTTVQFTVKVTKGVEVFSWVDLLALSEENRVIFESNKTAEVQTSSWAMVLGKDIVRADGHIPSDEIIASLEELEAKVKAGKSLSADESEFWTSNGESKGLKWLKDMRTYSRSTTIYLRNNLYGNGHMIYGYKSQYRDVQDTMLYVIEGGVTISNAIIRACDVGDQEIDGAYDVQGLMGNAIRFQTVDTGNHAYRISDNLIEYCIVENGETLIRCYNADFTLNGCILRNTASAAIYVPTRRNATGVMYSHLNINNCVCSNMLSTTLNAFFDGYSDDNDPASVEQAKKDVAEGRTFVLKQTGFWDIYNWQSTDVLNIIPDLSNVTLPVVGNVNLNMFVTDAFAENPEFKQYSRIYEQKEYFHLGLVISGISKVKGGYGFGTPYPIYSFEDERLQCVHTNEILTGNGTSTAMIKGVLNGHDILLFTYGQNGNLTPGTTYTVNNRLIRHLHGEI